jgi:serine/threonine protein kinase
MAGKVAYMPNVSTGEGPPEPPESGGGRLLAQRYRLLTEVGHGGMGTVWHAHDEVLGRDVAVKEVILPYGMSEEEREVHHKRTFREARTAARLAHPSVVTVFDVVEEDGRPWIIMELIRAPSLDQVIKDEGRLMPRRAAQIGRQMLGALHAAHEAGVLHRDVKPSNVLVADGDRVVLTDFGIATAAGDATLTQTGLVMGSPAYIAPERARGRTAGPACDLWSLGITLYAMVEGGSSPYERSEPMASLIAVISEEPERPAHAGPLRPVIDGLLRKEPAERMTALDAAALLDQIVRETAPTWQHTLPMTAVPEAAPGTADAPDAAAETADVPDTAEPAPERTPRPEPAPTPPSATRDDLPEQTDSPAAHSAHEPAGAAGDAVPQATPAVVPPTVAGPPPDRAAAPTGPVRSSGRGRTALAIAAIAVAALLILTVWAWLSRGDDEGGNAAGGGTQRSPRASASASAPPSPTAPRRSPAGFRRHTDPTGFSIAVPASWSGPERRTTSVFYYSPDRRTYVQVDQTDSPNPSALADWERSDRSAPGRFSNYRRIRLGPTGNQPPVPDTGDGSKSADWEFTWGSGAGEKRVLNRGFVTNGHGYAILISAPAGGWSTTIEEMRPVFASFDPAD